MNVFKIFATMSLVDAVSKPLAKVQSYLKKTEMDVGSLSARMGKLATGFGKVAVPAAIFLGTLGAMTGEAIAFESKMADVAKVVDFESPAELEQMSRTLQDLSLQIPIAAEGFADITAAAAQSGVAKNDLVEFSVQAAKMGVAFDVAAGDASKTMADWRAGMNLTLQETYSLADAVNYLSNNMNATASDISEVLNRMGAVGKAAGFTEKQLAALAATGLSAGATAEVVGTGLNSIFATLTAGTSMTDSAAAAFKSLGYDAAALAKNMQVDAQGTVMKVLESIAALPKEKQLSVITSAFGQLSLKSIAPMVGNLDNLRQAFGLVGDAANYAGSMQGEYDARSATTENSIQLLKNSFNVLAISVGTMFLPVVNATAKSFAWLVQVFIAVVRSPVGAFMIKLAAGIAAALVGTTGLIVALAVLKPALLLIGGALSAVFWPVMLIAGAVALLALAWKTDFLGIATTVKDFAAKVKLVFQGVLEIFKTLKDGRGELSADLAKKIQAAGLMGLVTTVSRVVYRVMSFFKGLAAGFKTGIQPAIDRLGDAFSLLGGHLKPLGNLFGGLAEKLGLAAGETDVMCWETWGKVIGEIAGGTLGFFVDTLGVVVGMISAVVESVNWLISAMDKLPKMEAEEARMNHSSPFMGGGFNAKPVQPVQPVETAVKDAAPAVANAAGDVMSGVENKVAALNLHMSGLKLMNTLASGIKAGIPAAVASVAQAMAEVNAYMPHSDAKKGPLSTLTASGRAIPGTLAQGVAAGAPQLVSAAGNMFNQMNLAPPYFEMPGPVFGQAQVAQFRLGGAEFAGGRLPEPGVNLQDGGETSSPFRSRLGDRGGQRTINLHIGKVELPGVVDADGFVAGLEAIVNERVS